MSIDLKIIPTSPRIASWKAINDELQALIGPAERDVLGDHATLHELGSNRQVDEGAPLEMDKFYYLNAAMPNTLMIAVPSKSSSLDIDELDEFGYLTDYKHSWDDATIRDLAQRWRAANFSYGLSSMVGRGVHEPALFIALATALARLSAGYVLVMDDDSFDLDAGYYAPEQFQHAHWGKHQSRAPAQVPLADRAQHQGGVDPAEAEGVV